MRRCRVGLRIVLFEACSAFTRVAACTLALPPIRDTLSEGFSYFVTSIAAPVASGWSVRRVGLAPTGKRRLVTAHTPNRHPRSIGGGKGAPLGQKIRSNGPGGTLKPIAPRVVELRKKRKSGPLTKATGAFNTERRMAQRQERAGGLRSLPSLNASTPGRDDRAR